MKIKKKKKKNLPKNKGYKEKKLSEDIEKIDDVCFGTFTVKKRGEVKWILGVELEIFHYAPFK